ncbi:hypothetical protein FB45DRAFT_1091073 [Roridomyces roridus]|uniref:MYND-type domain-containing protein n=1 Tax=Roridomyces roridus TaxID=1738132 RepID=A0AAD7BIN1_9AGAR|nr:hypothetical protein FB45DRAFT_1091073 [Roridomyces roridus]
MTTIHPLLRLCESSKWRPALRSTAKAAAAGSTPDLFRLIKFSYESGTRRLPQNERVMLTPILYRHLDPSSIPSVADLDLAAVVDDVVARVNGPVLTLGGLIGQIQDRDLKPKAAAPDLWARVHPWLEFLHTYRVLFPNLPAFNEIQLPWVIAYLTLFFMDHPNTSAVIYATSGMRTLIASAWGEIVHDPLYRVKLHTKLRMQSEMLSVLTHEITEPGHLEEIIAGVGGYDQLAALVVEHISQVLDDDNLFEFLDISAVFIARKPDCLLPALLQRGIVRTLVTAVRRLQTRPSYLQEFSSAYRCSALLAHFLKVHPGSTWLREALEAVEIDSGILRCLEQLLREVLPRALVFYDVVGQLKLLLPDLERLVGASQDFSNSAFVNEWIPFAALAKERVTALDAWEAKGRPFPQACDNMLCGKIDSRQKFRCCSACKHATYCSRDCQSADWEAVHRDICAEFRSIPPDFDFPHRRERGFLHALAQADFQRLRGGISTQLLKNAVESPETQSVVFLDYLGAGPASARLSTWAQLSAEDHPEMWIQWRRVQQSGGRLQMHLLEFASDRQHPKVLLFRKDASSDTQDGNSSPELAALPEGLKGIYSF